MNKAEMARKYTRQTVEQERDLEAQRKQDFQRIFQGLGSLAQGNGIITKKQEEIIDYLKYLSALTIKSKEEFSEMIKEMMAMRQAQKRIQVIWITTFLMIAVPISAFWVGWLIYWMFR